MVFVTGEAGIGKTTVVNALLASAAGVDGRPDRARQCFEQYGAGEAYLPVLDGSRGSDGGREARGSSSCCASTRRRGCVSCRR